MFKATHVVYFSATGNSKGYAQAVAKGFDLLTSEYDMTGPEWADKKVTLGSDELVIFSAPVFAGRIPPLAAERFSLFKGTGGPAVVLASYGNRAYDDALLEMADLARNLGFTLAAAAAVVAQHSLLPHNATGRPSQSDHEEAVSFGKSCLNKLQNMALGELAPLAIPGEKPYKDLPQPMPWKIYATDDCINCQSCVRLCPVAAIPSANPKTTGETCITCGRCLKICPVGARKIPDPVLKVMRERIDPVASGHKKSEWIL